MRQAAMDFDDEPEELTVPEDLGRILKWAPVFETWFRECDALAQRALESGLKVEGQKLVRKKPNRRWLEGNDDKLVAKVIRIAKGLSIKLAKKDLLSEPKVRSPAQVEKMGKGLKKAVHDLWETPEGGITMAAEDDPRDAVAPSAVSDFEDDLDG